MINIISAIIFAFSANIDNIAVGIAYGVKKIYISFSQNLIISFLTTIITILSMKIGRCIFYFLNPDISNIIGASALIGIGLFGVIKFFTNKIKNNKSEDCDRKIKKLRIKDLLIIVFTLSWNNIATGIAASITGINIILTFILTFVFGFSFMLIGNKLGKSVLSNKLENYSDLISSLLLIILGIIEII